MMGAGDGETSQLADALPDFPWAYARRCTAKSAPALPAAAVSEGVELNFNDLWIGYAYMYVCRKHSRTLSGRDSLKKTKPMPHEQVAGSRSEYPTKNM